MSVSAGGVPKRAVVAAAVNTSGLEGDGHHDPRHGGPDRAVCLFSLEVIERLRAEGHPIVPGAVGENLTLSGLDWGAVSPGGRLVFAEGVELEVVSFTRPCATIRGAFRQLEFRRIQQDLHSGESRVYARVIQPGALRVGEEVTYLAPPGTAADPK